MTGRDWQGNALVPGVNVDKIDVAAGLKALEGLGWSRTEDPNTFVLIEFCLMRWKRGEEEQAENQAIALHEEDPAQRAAAIDLTSWRVVLASAMAAATPDKRPWVKEPEPEIRVEYGLRFDCSKDGCRTMHEEADDDTIMPRTGPRPTTRRVNGHAVTVVERTVTYSPWKDSPA